ncbi:MAG: SIMPL domain-containing protein [Candidatus Fervidibacter sp.]|uniref:SIMPL domain-containing protein n=1 Tax=Candidatus Fervidibacter sp. TaxID=3100871 RepID=UPI0040498E69
MGEGETLSKAQEQLEQVEQAVFKALAKFEITRGQIQTERFIVTPLQPSVSALPTSAVLRPLGYRVQRGYSVLIPVTVENLTHLLPIADAVLQQGARPAVTVDSGPYSERLPYTLLEFLVRDPDKLVQQAMDNALNRARKLAEQASQHIGKVTLKLVRVQVTDIQTLPQRRTVDLEGETQLPPSHGSPSGSQFSLKLLSPTSSTFTSRTLPSWLPDKTFGGGF